MTNNQMEMNIEIQDHTGDRKLTLNWKPGDDRAERQIEDMFKDLQSAGYRFYSVKRVMGLFKKKGPEVERYDGKMGELIYEKPAAVVTSNLSKEPSGTQEPVEGEEVYLKMYEADSTEKRKYEEPKKYSPDKESVDTSRDYVATKKMRAG